MHNSYILKSEKFAQEILLHLSHVVHKACPEVEETLKWSFPNFTYKGKILCFMASFKAHCAFGFWLAEKMKDPNTIFIFGKDGKESAMGQFGKIKSIKDLPSDKILIKYIKEAMALIDANVTLTKNTSTKRTEALPLPDYVSKEFNKNKLAKSFFESLSNSQKNEYTSWIIEAKQEATKQKRLLQMILQLAEGKTRNWKYEK